MSVMARQRPRAKSARKLCSDSGNKVRKAEASHSESISGAKGVGPEGIGGEPVIAVHDLSRSGRAILAGLRELANLLHGVLHQGMKFIAEKQIVIDSSGKTVG